MAPLVDASPDARQGPPERAADAGSREGEGEGPVAAQAQTETAPSPHLTRRRTNSIIRPPRHLDSPSPPPPPDQAMGGGRRPSAVTSASFNVSVSASAPSPHPITFSFAAGTLTPSPLLPPPPLLPPAAHHHHSRPKAGPHHAPSVSKPYASDPVDDRRHPRELVPLDIGFPTPEMEGRIKKDDLDDRLLMATCAVLHSHENRALCPKEVAEVMFERQWLHNAGTTPFAHISTCIRSHLRRANGDSNSSPYPPLLIPFDLVGALTPPEVRAVGLRADARPAVKRGTLWYLSEAVLGKGVGAEDPFIRCRREGGMEPSEKDGVYVRTRQVHIPTAPVPQVHLPQPMDDDDDDTGMGRGKRKRRASSAAMAATDTVVTASPIAVPPMGTKGQPWASVHRRSQSFGGAHSLPMKSVVPRLRLRLTSLEEVDSGIDDSDGQGSDAQQRRKTKKKARRAASEGMSRGGSVNSVGSEDDDTGTPFRPAFSSAASSALLAQSLLAASTSSPSPPVPTPQSSVVSPESLHFASGPFQPHQSFLSASAPNLFSSFPSAPSPESMEVDDSYDYYTSSALVDAADSADEEDFHEAMLRGDDFDFEWGSETYTTGLALPAFSAKSKGKGREMSIDLPEPASFDDMDAASTPATTPRSPQPVEDDIPPGSFKMGMESTLCEAFAHESDPSAAGQESEAEQEERVDRTASTDSLASLVQEESETEPPPSALRRINTTDVALSVPLPSPLALELPTLPLSNAFSPDYDFVGHEDGDRSQYRSGQYRSGQYDRDAAESADDEDDEDDGDMVTVKIEDEGEPSLSSAVSSRQSSVFPLDSFSRRIMMTDHVSSSSSSSGSSDADSFDPHMIVSNALLASGLPVPQVAPSPPDTTDWGMHLDLDDLDLDLGGSAELLGPETVGLEELDLAWGGPAEQGENETDEEWCTRTAESRAMARGLAAGPTFLTGPTLDPFPNGLSELEKDERTRALVSPSSAAPLVEPTPSSLAATPRPETPPANRAGSKPAVVVYPKTALSLTPTVTATVVQRSIAVYTTSVVDSQNNTTYPLLRRIDTDYINGTLLLQGTFLDTSERESVLADIADAFKVSSGGCGFEGTWIPLPAARVVVAQNPTLAHLVPFFDDELGARFPEPIPSMRVQLRAACVTPVSLILGYPPLGDSHIVGDRFSPRVSSPAAPSSTPRRRKMSNLPPKQASVVEDSAPTRKTRRSAAAK